MRCLTCREADAALRASEERYRELFEIVFTSDLEGNVTSINRAGERLSGHDRGEILSMNVDFFPATPAKWQAPSRRRFSVSVP